MRGIAGCGAALAAPLLALALASCGTGTDQRACPNVEVIGDLSRLVQFRGGGQDPSDVAFTARIGDVRSRCVYAVSGVTTDLSVTFVGQRGPAGAKLPGAEITYFVAVTDGSRNIIAKRMFSDRLAFDDKGRARQTDELEQKLPISPTKSASDHGIIVGFQLTPEQVNFNEANPDK